MDRQTRSHLHAIGSASPGSALPRRFRLRGQLESHARPHALPRGTSRLRPVAGERGMAPSQNVAERRTERPAGDTVQTGGEANGGFWDRRFLLLLLEERSGRGQMI